jgi:hypothetical protein
VEPFRAKDATVRPDSWAGCLGGRVDRPARPVEVAGRFASDRRRERPHPCAQLRFTDAYGHRVTAFITDTPPGGRHRQHANLEVRHRSHPRVEDRIRCAKATGLRNLPCRGYEENKVCLELALTAADPRTWTQALRLDGELARCEPAALRYRLLHVAARLVRTGRTGHLKIDKHWPWATRLATAFARLRAAAWPA